MAYFLSKEELDKLQHAEREDLRSPIPTRIISKGPQSDSGPGYSSAVKPP